MSKTESPVVLITGSSRGIGLAIAEQLAKSGFSVVLNSKQMTDELALAANRVGRLNDERVLCLPFDVSDIACHEAMINQIVAHFGRIDCLVNNAGVSVHSRGDLLDITPESFDEQIAVNLRGQFFMSQAIARWMLANPTDSFRSIINISSSNGEAAALQRGEYCIAKAGLGMMTKLFALRLAENNINIYEILPGLIATNMTAPVADAYNQRLDEGFSPINRWGKPEDIAKSVKSLSCGEWAFTTGESIHIDGGLLIPHY